MVFKVLRKIFQMEFQQGWVAEGQTARAACIVLIQPQAGFGFLLLTEGTASDCDVTIKLNTRSTPHLLFTLPDAQGQHMGL